MSASIDAVRQPMTQHGDTGQMVALDSLRGVCACIVVLYHFNTTGVLTNLAFIRGGWMFVDFFFVLSGYVITAAYWRKLSDGFALSHFMILRVGRVYPVHFMVLLAFVAMECLALWAGGDGLTTREPFSGGRTPQSLVSNLLLLQALGLHPMLTWNGPSWSISAEIWTYLLAAMAMKLRPAATLSITGVAVVAALGVLAMTGTTYLDRSYDLGLVRCIYGFGLGMIAMIVVGRGVVWANFVVASIVELALAALCVVLVSVAGDGPLTLAAPPLFTVVVVVFARQSGVLSRLLQATPFRLLGLWSYSIYMIHVLVEARFVDVLRVVAGRLHLPFTTATGPGSMKIVAAAAPWPDVAAIGVLLLVIGLAALSYYWVERPCREWSRAYARSLHAGRAEKQVAPM